MIRFLQTPTTTKKIVLGGLLTIICVLMVITLIPGIGVSDFFGSGTTQAGVYASVGDEQVLTTDIDKRAQDMARRQGYPAQLVPLIKPQVADQMVTQKAMLAEARRMGLRVSDEELRDELQNGMFKAQLFPGGNWVGQQKYEEFVTQELGIGTVPEFEKLMKEDILFRKLSTMVEAGVVASDDEIKQQFIKQNVKIKFDYAVFTPDAVSKGITVTEPELRKYYEQNLPRIKDSIPETRKIKYILMDNTRVAAEAKPTQQDLERYYNDHREQFRVEDAVNVRHILIVPGGKKNLTPSQTTPPATQQEIDAAKAKADDLIKQLKGGADFAALAKKNSDDTGSAENGGSIGWITHGKTVPEFDKAAFALPKGGMTDQPVKTQFGFHIIKVDDKRAAHLQTLDEVKDQIEPIVAQEKAQKAAEQLAQKILSEAKGSGLDAAAAKNGFNVVTTGFFPNGASLPGIGQAPDLMDSVFSAKEKQPADMARTPQGEVIFTLEGIQPPQTPTFEQIRAKLEEGYKQERSMMVLEQKTRELADKAHAEHDLKKAAKELGADYKESDLVGPTGQVPDIGQVNSIQQAFEMKPGEISGPMQAGRNGVVVQVVERQEPTEAEFAAKHDEIKEGVLQQKRSEALQLFAESVRSRMEKEGKIKYNKTEQQKLQKSGLGS